MGLVDIFDIKLQKYELLTNEAEVVFIFANATLFLRWSKLIFFIFHIILVFNSIKVEICF